VNSKGLAAPYADAELEALKQSCIAVAGLAGSELSSPDIGVDRLEAPHRAPSEDRTRIVYIFFLRQKPLKVGKSAALRRGTRLGNNYNPSVGGSLAGAILECKDAVKGVAPEELHSEIDSLRRDGIKSWMERNLTLVRFRFNRATAPEVIVLLEQFVRCRVRPLFAEGWGSRRKQKSLDPVKRESAMTALAAKFAKTPPRSTNAGS